MNIFIKIKNKIHNILKSRSEMSRLHSEDNPVIKSIANSLDDVMKNRCSYEERKWIDKLEELRNNLETSSTEISITDFGAGSKDINLTDREMYQGKVVKKTIGEVCRSASKPYKWSFLLFKLVREFRPCVCLELGTNLGISAAYQAAGLKLNNKGKIVTLEGAESLASLSKKNLEKLGLENFEVVIGRFQDTLPKVLKDNAPFDFVFIDGHHEEKATLTYFQEILPFLSDGAILIFDDINWSSGMIRAWNTIQKNENLEFSFDLYNLGICNFTKKTAKEKKSFKIKI